MSLKGASAPHVQPDHSVVERRLRPIYDLLDSGNNKRAVQECDKVLKKTPNLHCGRALKALALLRLGKDAECGAMLDALVAENPLDDNTLQSMSLCYRELNQQENICKIYETAVKLDVNNEEHHTHLFMSYVRIADFKSQQKVAMTLYKHKPKSPYYCWAVQSIILQATRGEGATDAKKRSLLLLLAERMLAKLHADGKMEAEQEVQLYLMVLGLLDKHVECLEVLDGPLGEKLLSTNEARLELLVKLQQWEEVNLVNKRMLIESSDIWNYWQAYIGSVFKLYEKRVNDQGGGGDDITNNHNSHPGGEAENEVEELSETVDDTPEKAHEFICHIIEGTTENSALYRGPHLARFELCRKMLEANLDVSEVLGDKTQLFVEYFRRFGHKPCSVSDLSSYLDLLNIDEQREMSRKLLEDVGIFESGVAEDIQQLQRHIGALRLGRMCGACEKLSSNARKTMVQMLWLYYCHGHQLYGADMLPTDFGVADTYCLLAVHLMFDEWMATGDEKILGPDNSAVAAAAALNALLHNSPSNFHAKLLLVRLYHTIGCGLSAHDAFTTLDIKQLQLDSLGFVHSARILTTGLFTVAANVFDVTLKFFSQNIKDSSDYLTYCYKYGSFGKLDEFMDFRERLKNSLHYTNVIIDRIMISLIVDCTNLEALYNLDISGGCFGGTEEIDWDTARDNQDLNVYVSWDKEGLQRNQVAQLYFKQNVNCLKLRHTMLRCLATTVDIAKSLDGIRDKHIGKLEGLLDTWLALDKEISTSSVTSQLIPQHLLMFPLPSRLHGTLASPYVTVLKPLFDFVVMLGKDQPLDAFSVDAVTTPFKAIANLLESYSVETCIGLRYRRPTMELVCNCVEILTISSWICLVCNDMLKPPSNGGGRKTKKRGPTGGAAESKPRQILQAIANEIKSQLDGSSNLLKLWLEREQLYWNEMELQRIQLESNVISEGVAKNDIDAVTSGVFSNIRQSFEVAHTEVQQVLKNKVKLMCTVFG